VARELCQLHGANAHVRDHSGWTACMHAAHRGHNAVLRELRLHGRAALHARDGRGWCPLLLAAAAGHTEMVSLLLTGDYVSDVDSCNNKQQTSVMCAASFGRAATMRALAAHHGARTDRLDVKGRTLVMLAAGTRRCEFAASKTVAEVLALLGDSGGRLAARNHRGLTALMLAAKAGNTAAFPLLVRAMYAGVMLKEAARMVRDAVPCVVLPLPNIANLTDER